MNKAQEMNDRCGFAELISLIQSRVVSSVPGPKSTLNYVQINIEINVDNIRAPPKFLKPWKE